jgi:putative inorganic carbon (HCO3(-)) transporter
MIEQFKNQIWVVISLLIFLGASIFFIWQDLYWLCLFPIVLIGIYTAIYHTKVIFLGLAFLTPLSVNIEEFTNGLGLFLPTEPLFFGLMLLTLFFELRKRTVPQYIINHPIVISACFYLLIVFLSSIVSSNPIVSFKFLLAKLWYFIPMLLLAPVFFQDRKTIYWFVFLFVLGTVFACVFTLVHHSLYNFGEKEGHWVMYPFFKDHTIYGAIVALTIPWSIFLFYSKNTNPLEKVFLVFILIVLIVALFFSYTRAAWLSVAGSLVIYLVIYLKVRLSYIVLASSIFLIALFTFWDQVEMELARNQEVHTTEEFGTRLQSAANVTTDASNLERINRWACAIAMFKERPLLGFGPGTYQFEYAQFQEPENLTIISTNFGDLGNAHSEYLSALSETGVFGLISFLFFVIIVFYTGISLYYKSGPENNKIKILLLMSVLSLSTYFIHAFLNNYLDTDKASIPILGICAVFIAVEHQQRSNQKTNAR